MIDISVVKQQLPLAWARDLETEALEGSPYEYSIWAESGNFQFTIMEYERQVKGFKFAILICSATGSGRGVYQQDFATLEEAIAGLTLWIRRTILDLSAALRPSEGLD